MESVFVYVLLLIATALFCFKMDVKLYNKILFGVIFYIVSYILILYFGYLFFKIKYTMIDNFGYNFFTNFLSYINAHFELIITSVITFFSILLFKKLSKDLIIGIFSILLFIFLSVICKILLYAVSLDCSNKILEMIISIMAENFKIILFAIYITVIQYVKNRKIDKSL
mgnify:CR=1 FL=1